MLTGNRAKNRRQQWQRVLKQTAFILLFICWENTRQAGSETRQQRSTPEKNRAQKRLGDAVYGKHTVGCYLCISRAPAAEKGHSVSVVSWLEWSSHWDIDVLGLVSSQFGQLGSQLGQMQGCNLLVQVLGQDVHLVLVATCLALIPQLQLGNDLKAHVSGPQKLRIASQMTIVTDENSATLVRSDLHREGLLIQATHFVKMRQ